MVPEWLGWTDVFLSVVAFGIGLVTLPTAFQMWWGKPAVSVTFTSDRRESGVGLKCFIANDPVKGWRKKLAYRETANNLCMISTIRDGKGELVGDMIRPTINVENGTPSLRVNLDAGLPGIAVICFQEAGQQKATINDQSKNITIEPGEYKCELKVIWNRGFITIRNGFIIGRSIDETYWATVRSGPPHGR